MSKKMIIISPGLLSTVQDEGRFGYQSSGFQVSGCMDKKALHDGNVLVNNPCNAAVIEMLFMGITAVFEAATYIAVTGAEADINLNGKKISMYKAISVKAGDRLEIGTAKNGRFIYLAVAGGINVPEVLGSRSTNLKCKIGGFNGRALLAGDELEIEEYVSFFPNQYLKEMPIPEYISRSKSEPLNVHVIAGTQDDMFTEHGLKTFSSSTYKVTDESDRMGYRVDGPSIEYKSGVDILSDGIVFGSIQVPSNGKPMILMADRQTTGGYAKIATVISADLHRVAQCLPGDEIRLHFVSLKEAEKLNKAYDKELSRFKRKTGYSPAHK